MRLSSAYLSEQLNQHFEVLHQSAVSEKDAYQRPFLCEDPDENIAEHVCVNPVSRSEAKPEILDINAGEALAISCDASITAVLINELQELFDRNDELERQSGFQRVVRQTEDSNSTLKSIFQKILSDRTADYMRMSRRLSSEGWKEEHEYFCLVLQITYMNEKELSADVLCHYLGSQFPDSVSFQYQEEIVSFFNLTRLGMVQNEIESSLAFFIRDNYLIAGYSRTMKGHMNLRRQYVQAKLALDVGSRQDPYLWIHHFDQIALTHMLEQMTRRLPAEMLCHEGLLRLQESDEKNHTEYVRTLKTWLDAGGNATQSAERLFIHRSTFLYRMDRIREILDSDLKDPDEIFYISLSIRLLEQKNS